MKFPLAGGRLVWNMAMGRMSDRRLQNRPLLASPHSQSHLVDPFVKWSTARVLVQLVLEADLILPSGTVDVPGLIEAVGYTIEDQRIVAILRGIIDELIVLLDVVPARRPVRTSDPVEDPSSAVAIPRRPVAISKVALAADHKFLGRQYHVEIELGRPEVGFGSGVMVDPEVP